jgi:nitrous oxidase accessory protein NosD
MKPFDYAAARQAGYSEEEIGRFLANESSFDYDGAISEGYKPQQIVDFLSIRAPEPLAAPEVEDKRTVGNAVQDLAASFGVGT